MGSFSELRCARWRLIGQTTGGKYLVIKGKFTLMHLKRKGKLKKLWEKIKRVFNI